MLCIAPLAPQDDDGMNVGTRKGAGSQRQPTFVIGSGVVMASLDVLVYDPADPLFRKASGCEPLV